MNPPLYYGELCRNHEWSADTFQWVLSTFGVDKIAYFLFCWYGINSSEVMTSTDYFAVN